MSITVGSWAFCPPAHAAESEGANIAQTVIGHAGQARLGLGWKIFLLGITRVQE